MSNRFLTTDAELMPYFLSVAEIRCHDANDASEPCRDCGGEVKLLLETAEAFKAIREEHGAPIHVLSGHRCRKKQARLFNEAVAKYGSAEKARKKVAPPGASPHEYSCALDLRNPSGVSTAAFKRLIDGVLGVKGSRMGGYATFVHIDLGWLLVPNPNPRSYRPGIRW